MPTTDNLKFGGGLSGTALHPAVMIFLIIAILLIFLLPRKYVVIPFLVVIFLAPFGQQLYVGGVHLFVPRILILCGWIRIAWTKMSSQSQVASGGFTAVDKIFLLWAIFRATATYLEFMQYGAFVNQCAFLWDALGGFFLLRFLIRDEEDVLRVVRIFACVVFVLGITMLNEKLRGVNVFGYIGGRLAPVVRDGAIRSQGPFTGPIPAGTFAATLLALLAWLWKSGKSKALGALGLIGATVMVVTSASSTPLLAYIAVILGIAMWPLRGRMRTIRWGIVALLVGLQLVMKAPVWFLINHIDFVAGNSGYHRAMIIDMCVTHFWDWWLIGVKSTADWGWDMWDQANQFVGEAESGGLLTLICFVLLVSRNFSLVGRARKLVEGDRQKEWFLWLFGVTLFAYVVSFFGISFSDQSEYAWFAVIAMITTITAPILATAGVASPSPAMQTVKVQVRSPYAIAAPARTSQKLLRNGLKTRVNG
jgi:hypothetical protein